MTTLSPITKRIDDVADNTNVSINTAPVTAKIELTGRCSLNCRFCAHDVMLRNNIRQRFITREQFDVVLDNLQTIESIRDVGLFYLGESALHPQLDVFYKCVHDLGYFTFFTTNGTIVNDCVVNAIPFIDSFKVSWNYTDADDFAYKTRRPKSLFSKIISNITTLCELCHENNKPFYISTVLDTEPERYEQILNTLPCDQHYFIPLQNHGGLFQSGTGGVVGEYMCMVKQLPCWSLFKGIYVDADLNVRMCCYGYDDCHILGNLNNCTLRDIVKSRRDIQQKHLDGVIPIQCDSCLADVIVK